MIPTTLRMILIAFFLLSINGPFFPKAFSQTDVSEETINNYIQQLTDTQHLDKIYDRLVEIKQSDPKLFAKILFSKYQKKLQHHLQTIERKLKSIINHYEKKLQNIPQEKYFLELSIKVALKKDLLAQVNTLEGLLPICNFSKKENSQYLFINEIWSWIRFIIVGAGFTIAGFLILTQMPFFGAIKEFVANLIGIVEKVSKPLSFFDKIVDGITGVASGITNWFKVNIFGQPDTDKQDDDNFEDATLWDDIVYFFSELIKAVLPKKNISTYNGNVGHILHGDKPKFATLILKYEESIRKACLIVGATRAPGGAKSKIFCYRAYMLPALHITDIGEITVNYGHPRVKMNGFKVSDSNNKTNCYGSIISNTGLVPMGNASSDVDIDLTCLRSPN